MVEKTVELAQVVEKSAGFSLPYFEFLVCVRRYEAAGRLLVLMLDQLDTQYGRWDVFSLQQQSIQQHRARTTRGTANLAAASGTRTAAAPALV